MKFKGNNMKYKGATSVPYKGTNEELLKKKDNAIRFN